MVAAIADRGMEIDRFQLLAQAQQQGNITDVSEDPDEIAKFNEAGQEVMKVQQEVQQQLQQKIAENEMEVQTFQEMSIAYNQSPQVKEKIDSMIEDLE
jgi:TRAP-type mannitol/chloroaromatic compound transport system substrate-binding protein